MQTDVSVKNPTRSAVLTSRPISTRLMSDLHACGVGDSCTPAMLLDERLPVRSARSPAGTYGASQRLHFLDVHVRVEGEMGQLVGRVADAQTGIAPVIRQTDLMQPASVDGERSDAVGHEHAGLDRRASGDDRRPATVL